MSDPNMSRRSALAGAAVTAVAGIAGYAVATNSAAAQPRTTTGAANGYGSDEAAGTRLAAVSDIPDDGGLILSDAAVVLTHDESGEVLAFSATCTHQGCTVASIEDGVIICPCHGSHFDLATGEPVAGPARAPLPPIAVDVRNGDVFTAETGAGS